MQPIQLFCSFCVTDDDLFFDFSVNAWVASFMVFMHQWFFNQVYTLGLHIEL